MINLVFYPALLGFVCCLLSAGIILNVYRKHRYIELIILVAGFICYAYLPLNHIIFTFVTGQSNEYLRTYLGRIAVISGSLSPLIVWVAMYRLTGDQLKIRHYGLVLLLPLILGYTIRSYFATWNESMWEVDYNPDIILAINGITIFWVLLETIYISYENYRVVSFDQRYPYLMILFGWIVLLMTSIILIIERVVLALQSRIFIIFGGFGILIIAIALTKDPFAIVPRTIGSKLCVISDKSSGGEIYSVNFTDKKDKTMDNTPLFSSAMSGVLNLLEEITGQKDIPKKFGYANYTIMFEETEHLICFLICEREIHPVRVELKHLLQEFEENNYYGIEQKHSSFQKYHKLIFNKLKFAI